MPTNRRLPQASTSRSQLQENQFLIFSQIIPHHQRSAKQLDFSSQRQCQVLSLNTHLLRFLKVDHQLRTRHQIVVVAILDREATFQHKETHTMDDQVNIATQRVDSVAMV